MFDMLSSSFMTGSYGKPGSDSEISYVKGLYCQTFLLCVLRREVSRIELVYNAEKIIK